MFKVLTVSARRTDLQDLTATTMQDAIAEFRAIVISDYAVLSRDISACILEVVAEEELPMVEWMDEARTTLEERRREAEITRERALYERLKQKYEPQEGQP